MSDRPDEHGNIWIDDAVPSGMEIAEVMLEIIRHEGWDRTWDDCQGLQICPRVRVWLDGYMDWDYKRVFLLRIWTNSETNDEGRFLTLTDHLAVYDNVGGGRRRLDVEWRQDPRLFFDADREWGFTGYRWWISWIEAVVEANEGKQDAPPTSVIEHSRQIVERDQELARAMGLCLPYLK